MKWKIVFVLFAALSLTTISAETAFGQGGTGRENPPTSTPKPPARKTSGVKKQSSAIVEQTAPPTPAVVPKIAVFNSAAFENDGTGISRLVNAGKSLQAEFKPRWDELITLRGKIDQLGNELSNARQPDPKAFQDKLDQYERLKRDYKYKSEDAQAAYDRRRRDILEPVVEDIRKFMNSFNQKAGIVSAIDASTYQGLILADDALDITKSLVEAYNQGHQPTLNLPAPKVGLIRSDTLSAEVTRLTQAKKSVELEFAYEKTKKANETDQDYQKRQETVKTNFERRLAQAMGPIYEDVSRSLERFARARGYNLVIDLSKGLPEGFQADNLADFSRAFIADYNQHNP